MASRARKRLKPKNPNDKVLRAVRPNAGLTAAYRKKLDALIQEMADSVDYWLSASYKANEPRIAQDELPASALRAAIRKLTARWQRRFNAAAPKLADYFATAVEKRSSTALKNILKESGISVDFKFTDTMRDVARASINENVSLIRSIQSSYFTQIEGAVMRSVQEGRDLGSLAKYLETQHGVTRRRAATISRDQNNKMTAAFTRVRQTELGIKTAVWTHSMAGKHPRPSHLAASGKEYEIDKGMYLDGVWTWPGREINCKCFSKSIIKGFS